MGLKYAAGSCQTGPVVPGDDLPIATDPAMAAADIDGVSKGETFKE